MQGIDFQKNMPDPTPVIAGFCRQNNIEVFGSIRMTDFIRQARRRVDAISRQRVRPVLLGVRVPGTIETCNRIGLDIETWLRERLVDRLLTGGGYVCYSTPAEEPVALGHRHDVPVYPCINCPANFKPGEGNLRAAASNLWWAGADGIYLWNFHYISAPGARGYGRPSPELYRKHLPEITDPRRLKYLDKSFAVNRRVWEQYQRASAPAPLALALGKSAGDGTHTIAVRIGDDIPDALRNDKLRDATLRLGLGGAVAGDVLAIKFNDAAAKATATAPGGQLEMTLPPAAIQQGVNQLELAIAQRGNAADKLLAVNQARVDVRYHRSG